MTIDQGRSTESDEYEGLFPEEVIDLTDGVSDPGIYLDFIRRSDIAGEAALPHRPVRLRKPAIEVDPNRGPLQLERDPGTISPVEVGQQFLPPTEVELEEFEGQVLQRARQLAHSTTPVDELLAKANHEIFDTKPEPKLRFPQDSSPRAIETRRGLLRAFDAVTKYKFHPERGPKTEAVALHNRKEHLVTYLGIPKLAKDDADKYQPAFRRNTLVSRALRRVKSAKESVSTLSYTAGMTYRNTADRATEVAGGAINRWVERQTTWEQKGKRNFVGAAAVGVLALGYGALQMYKFAKGYSPNTSPSAISEMFNEVKARAPEISLVPAVEESEALNDLGDNLVPSEPTPATEQAWPVAPPATPVMPAPEVQQVTIPEGGYLWSELRELGLEDDRINTLIDEIALDTGRSRESLDNVRAGEQFSVNVAA